MNKTKFASLVLSVAMLFNIVAIPAYACAPTPAPNVTNVLYMTEPELLAQRVNQYRTDNKVGTLSMDSELTSYALKIAIEMCENPGYARKDGRAWITVVSDATDKMNCWLVWGVGYTWDEFADYACKSYGDKPLRAQYDIIGVSGCQKENTIYWVMILGDRVD